MVMVFYICQRAVSQICRHHVEMGYFVRTLIMMFLHCSCCGNASYSSHYLLVPQWQHDECREMSEMLLCLCVVGIKWLQTRWMLKYIISLTFRTTLPERPHIFNIKRAETTHHGRKREWLLCPAICIPGSRSQRTKMVSLMPWKGLMRTQKHLDRSQIHSLISVPQICSKFLFPVSSSRVKKMAQQSVLERGCSELLLCMFQWSLLSSQPSFQHKSLLFSHFLLD